MMCRLCVCVCVCVCVLERVNAELVPPFPTLPHPNSAAPSSSWQLLDLPQDGRVLFCLPVCGLINDESAGSSGTGPLVSPTAAAFSVPSARRKKKERGRRRPLIGSGEVI